MKTVEDKFIVTLIKGEERFVFIYMPSTAKQALRLVGQFASNPDLNFSWYDAAVVSQKIRAEVFFNG